MENLPECRFPALVPIHDALPCYPARATDVLPLVRQAQTTGATSLHQFASALTARSIPTPSVSGVWHPASIRRVLAYAEAA